MSLTKSKTSAKRKKAEPRHESPALAYFHRQWQAIEKLSAANQQAKDCVPCDAAIKEQFEAGKLNELVGK